MRTIPLLGKAVPKNCWRCGNIFFCGAQSRETTCWCAALPAISASENSDCLCPVCLSDEVSEDKSKGEPAATEEANLRPSLVEGEDYYWEGSAIVFTAAYLLRRGFCCGNGCRHCPFEGATGKRPAG